MFLKCQLFNNISSVVYPIAFFEVTYVNKTKEPVFKLAPMLIMNPYFVNKELAINTEKITIIRGLLYVKVLMTLCDKLYYKLKHNNIV